jgi:hypothetical protein
MFTGMVIMLTSLHSLREQDESLDPITAAFGEDSIVELIHDIPAGSVVIPRYRAIPFGDLLEREVAAHGSELINTFHQHRNIADSSAWTYLLDGFTPPSFGIEDIPNLPEGEWFVKGETNSLKNRWREACYAPTTRELITVVSNFQKDAFVGHQRVVIKPFERFRQLTGHDGEPLISISGQPIWNERRVFVLDGVPISQGAYWSNFEDDASDARISDPWLFADTLAAVISRVRHLARFMVIDLAETPEGDWRVIELNDGSMAGLSNNNPDQLWANFATVIRGETPELNLDH